jgi:hypothetical protein
VAGAEPLPEGLLAQDETRPDGLVVHSLDAHGRAAAERHRWIECEKAGRDLGTSVLHDWCRRHWTSYARARLIEHLYGWRCWGAFGLDDHALFQKQTVEHHVPGAVLAEIVRILRGGGENLDVIAWALAGGHDLDPILWLLDRIDINGKRPHLLAERFDGSLPT